jgi:mannan endo-1,4-beta-mannosidase
MAGAQVQEEQGAFHEPERRSPTRLVSVYGPNARLMRPWEISMNKICLLLMVLALSAAADPAQPPANPEASPEARAILKYIQGLTARTDKRVLSGQFTDCGAKASVSAAIFGQIQQRTGECPAILGVDYANWYDGQISSAAPNAAAIQQWRQGGLVQIEVHCGDPFRTNLAVSGLRDRNVDMAPLLDPESPAHTNWMRELDRMATGLQQLRDARVVVLWRPFHEMNGGWFWWGAQKPEVMIRLWRQMFDYFTQDRHLNNLLWVYAPNHGDHTADYYPGDHYADLVGVDAYTDFVDPEHIKGTAELLALPKPFGFAEFGPHDPFNPPGDYDYLRFIDGVQKNFPRAVWFLSWHGNWGLTTNQNVTALLHHPWVVSRADLPMVAGLRKEAGH